MKPEDFVLEATDFYYKGEFDRAIDALDKAIELKPDFAEAWYNKGITFSVMGRVEEEIMAYDHALAINPRYAEAWNNKASSLGKLGRYEEALEAAAKAYITKVQAKK